MKTERKEIEVLSPGTTHQKQNKMKQNEKKQSKTKPEVEEAEKETKNEFPESKRKNIGLL